MKLRLALLGAAATLFAGSHAALAQDANVEGRVKKLEKEMVAVQRQVFPNGAGKFFEPEIKPETATPNSNNSSSSAVSDLIVRVDALEAQLATLTGQVERQNNNYRLMDERLKAVEAELKQQKAAATAPPANTAAAVPLPAANSTPPKTTTVASTARMQAVAAIEKPVTGDAFDDSYTYGYRLWEGKFYPEAQVQLADTVKKFPKHPRASFARNLLGRAWLDDKKPASAVKILYDNYKDDPRGERAPDSLYFLGVALIDLNKPVEACEAFGQLAEAYPDIASGRLSDRVASGRARAKCK
ncbi:hypothetical protein ACFOWX_13465 [Sphingorhabdus arenilitoris]|uniref:Tetratricopeptide repeat protein n=1 Tax=Sphingorhabdus arenilitoris TaxID=1490041 RepID=A0ABV8RMC6_9SPHN